ncbi:MAG TPA: hypothetical protein VK578_21135 [Edaphobacter sp.]|jgi:hypothetical protein|nr:hypothetical protein [Edaphobacter sp.]
MNSAEEEREASMTSNPQRSSTDEDASVSGISSAMAAALYRKMPVRHDEHRIVELERENSRLQKLVAELLLKNQQLRKPE